MTVAMSTVAFAVRDNGGTGDEDHPVLIDVTNEKSPLYSVAIEWGSLEFAYAYSRWDAQSHVYTGAWTGGSADSVSAEITVTNHSNKAVDITAAYDKVNNAVPGVSSDLKYGDAVVGADPVELPSAEGKAVDAAELTATYTLEVAGKPDNTHTVINDVTLGTITITVAAAE